jgi:hypothetical protein
MAMDINDFGLEQEAFGFGDSYEQMSRSNTDFLNLLGMESRKVKQIKADYYKRIDALPASDQAGRDALFNELEGKLKELNASQSDVSEVRGAKDKSKRGEKIASGLEKALNIFTQVKSGLGMGKKIEGEQDGGGGGNSGGGGGKTSTGSGVPTWVWITSGVVVLGLGIFAIYKFRK